MNKVRWIVLGVIACLIVAAGAYLWASSLMDSLYAYRSPLHNSPPPAGAPLGQPLTRRVVFVLIDALRVDTALKPEVMPFLHTLRARGAWATVHSRAPSYSDPGYSVLMIGAWPDLSDGPAMNAPYEDTLPWTQDNLFTAAHRAGLKTAVSGYYWFEKLIPQEAVDAHFYTAGEDAAADRAVVDAARPWLEGGHYAFMLIHLDQVDYAGHHEGGPRDPRWDAAARRADELLREIVSSLDLARDTVIVISDHGQIDRGGHGGEEPIVLIEPFVMAGAGVRAGKYPDIQQVDIAPTVAVLLGTNLPASSQGRPLVEMLDLSEAQKDAIRKALSLQQALLLDAYLSALAARPANVHVEPGHDPLGAYQAMLQQVRESRLKRERLPRFVLAAALALIPALILFRKRSRDLVWMLGGALLYMLLFHFGYAVLAGRTYSLSSVASADDIILFTAGAAAVSLIMAWLATSLGLGLFRSTSRRAAEGSLAMVFITLYLLALPILWSFALNGVLITWTLPDFGSMFLGFLSTLQSLIVAALGLLLTGLAALVARF